MALKKRKIREISSFCFKIPENSLLRSLIWNANTNILVNGSKFFQPFKHCFCFTKSSLFNWNSPQYPEKILLFN